MHTRTRDAMLRMVACEGVNLLRLGLHLTAIRNLERLTYIERVGPSWWRLTDTGLVRITEQERQMAKRETDTLRFRVLDLLNRKEAMVVDQVCTHLRSEPSATLAELERAKRDREVTQTGARGPWAITDEGRRYVRAVVAEPESGSDVDALLALAERVAAKTAELNATRERHAARIAQARNEVVEATKLLAQANLALSEAQQAQHNDEADIADEIRNLREQIGRRMK